MPYSPLYERPIPGGGSSFGGGLGTGTGTASATLPVPVTGSSGAGGALILWVSWSSTTTALTGVTDNRGNTWALAPTTTGTNRMGALATCLAPATPLVPGDTVTATFAASVPTSVGQLAAYRGLTTSGPSDAVASAAGAGTSGTSQAVDSGPATTTAAGDALFGLATEDQVGADVLSATGWTLVGAPTVAGTPIKLHAVHRLNVPVGTYNLAGSLSGGGTLVRAWIAAEWAYKKSGSALVVELIARGLGEPETAD